MFKSKQLLPAIGVNMGGMRTFAALRTKVCYANVTSGQSGAQNMSDKA